MDILVIGSGREAYTVSQKFVPAGDLLLDKTIQKKVRIEKEGYKLIILKVALDGICNSSTKYCKEHDLSLIKIFPNLQKALVKPPLE